MTFETRALEPFGLEIRGLAAWTRLSDADAEALAEAWSRHGLLVLRRQALSEHELVAFSRRFGEPEVIVRRDWTSADHPEVIRISNMKDHFGNAVGGLGAGELDWHTDQSYVVAPATGSILHMVEMPDPAPVTCWASLELAHAALDEDDRALVEDLRVVYDYWLRQSTYDDEPRMSRELREATPPVTHPLVNVHPATGRRALYLDPSTAAGIEGWADARGRALIERLARHATVPERVYIHRWQVGDVVMWDNGSLMHRRDAFDPAGNRLLKRTTLRLPPERHIVPAGAPARRALDSAPPR